MNTRHGETTTSALSTGDKMTNKFCTKNDCIYQDIIEACVKKLERVHVEIYGNGGRGMKDDLRALGAQMKINTILTASVLGTIAGAIVTAFIKQMF